MEHKFKKPPVVEVACGVRFKNKVCDLRIISEFYDFVKDKFPNIKENQPIMKPLELEKLNVNAPSFIPYKPEDVSFVRYWFLDHKKDNLIQIQDIYLLLNWRKNDKEENIYPPFKTFYSEYKVYFQYLDKLLKKYDKSNEVIEYELTYIDYIYTDDLGIKIGQIGEVFDYFKQEGITTLINGFNFTYGIKLEQLGGNYAISYQSANHSVTKKPMIYVQTSIKGKLTKSFENMDAWFENANELIVDEFVKHLTDKSKKIWGYSYE